MRTKIQKWINSILSQYFFEKKKPNQTNKNKTKQSKKSRVHSIMISMKLSSHPEANIKHQGLTKLNFSGDVTVVFQWRNDCSLKVLETKLMGN